MTISAFGWPAGALTSVAVTILLYVLGVPGGVIWRAVLGIAVIPAVAVIILRTKLPESPRWLLAMGKEKEFRQSMSKLLGIAPDQIVIPPPRKKVHLGHLFRMYGKSEIYLIMAWVAASIAFPSTYIPYVLHSLRLTSFVLSLGFTAIVWSSAALAMVTLMIILDRVGRKPLIITAALLIGITDLVLGFEIFKLPVIAVAVLFAVNFYFDFIAVGTAYTIESEVLPTEIKATGGGLAFGTNRALAFLAATFSPIALAANNFGTLIILLAIGEFIAFVTMIILGTESKQKNLEKLLEREARDVR